MEQEITPADLAYETGVNDAAAWLINGETVLTLRTGVLTEDEAFAYLDGLAWAYNNREVLECPA